MSEPLKKEPLCPYRVYFEQVNQTMWDVKARSMREAYDKARRQWKREYGSPQVAEITRRK